MRTVLPFPSRGPSRLASPLVSAPSWRQALHSTSTRESKELDYSQRRNASDNAVSGAERRDSIGTRTLEFIARMTGFYSRKSVLGRSAVWIYKSTFDDIDYESFFKVCKLPDSMHSWFLIAHLHVWLLMVRLKREGEDGEFLTKQLVALFWDDVKQRPRALGVHSGSLIAKSMREWSGMFTGLIVAYEEGLLLNDKILAAAIWRNLVGDKSASALTDLEAMVHYIRSQVKHMDSIDSELLLRNGRIKLLPFAPQSTHTQ